MDTSNEMVAHYDGDNLLVDGEVVPRYDLLGDNSKRNTITSVTFPEGLQSIGDGAFYQCLLTSVSVPDLKTSIHRDAFSECPALESRRLASGHKSVVSYLRCCQLTVRRRVAVLLCMQRLRSDLYGGNYVAVSSAGTTPAEGSLEGKLAFQMITSDDLLRYTLEFLGPEKEEEDDGESDDDENDDDDEKEDEEAGARKRKRKGRKS